MLTSLFMWAVASLVVIVAVFLYFRNAYYAVQAVNSGDYSIRTVMRIVGIFVIFFGVAMGVVGKREVTK